MRRPIEQNGQCPRNGMQPARSVLFEASKWDVRSRAAVSTCTSAQSELLCCNRCEDTKAIVQHAEKPDPQVSAEKWKIQKRFSMLALLREINKQADTRHSQPSLWASDLETYIVPYISPSWMSVARWVFKEIPNWVTATGCSGDMTSAVAAFQWDSLRHPEPTSQTRTCYHATR